MKYSGWELKIHSKQKKLFTNERKNWKMKMIITYDDDDYYFTEPQKKKNFNFYLKVRNMRENFSSPSFFYISFLKISS